MLETLRCPTCAGPLDLARAVGRTLTCPYCGAGVLLSGQAGAVAAEASHDRHTDAIAEVVRVLRAGDKIGAIKAYRDALGGSLSEAKDAVDRIEAGQAEGSVAADPTSHSAGPKRGCGCLAILIVLVALGGYFAYRQLAGPGGAGNPGGTGGIASALGVVSEPPGTAEVLRFGSEGTGAGRFMDARGIAVDGAGRIYVAEYQGGRVQAFDSLGTFLTQWMADPDMPLVDLAADRDGTVYVVQSGRIHRFDGATGRPLPERPRLGPAAHYYNDLTVALDGSLYAVVSTDRIVHLSRDGEVLQTIDLHEVLDDRATASRVAVSGTGDLYVTDVWTAEVYHLDPSGRFVDRFGGKGTRPDHLNAPWDLAFDGRGRLYVSDLARGIRVFDASGHFLDAIGATDVIFGLAFNDRDELHATYRNDHQVVKLRLTE